MLPKKFELTADQQAYEQGVRDTQTAMSWTLRRLATALSKSAMLREACPGLAERSDPVSLRTFSDRAAFVMGIECDVDFYDVDEDVLVDRNDYLEHRYSAEIMALLNDDMQAFTVCVVVSPYYGQDLAQYVLPGALTVPLVQSAKPMAAELEKAFLAALALVNAKGLTALDGWPESIVAYEKPVKPAAPATPDVGLVFKRPGDDDAKFVVLLRGELLEYGTLDDAVGDCVHGDAEHTLRASTDGDELPAGLACLDGDEAEELDELLAELDE